MKKVLLLIAVAVMSVSAYAQQGRRGTQSRVMDHREKYVSKHIS